MGELRDWRDWLVLVPCIFWRHRWLYSDTATALGVATRVDNHLASFKTSFSKVLWGVIWWKNFVLFWFWICWMSSTTKYQLSWLRLVNNTFSWWNKVERKCCLSDFVWQTCPWNSLGLCQAFLIQIFIYHGMGAHMQHERPNVIQAACCGKACV